MDDTTGESPDFRRFLIDLESPYDAEVSRPYDAVALVRFALASGDYWAGLALNWLEAGVPSAAVVEELTRFENERHRPQSQRHAARRIRKAAQG